MKTRIFSIMLVMLMLILCVATIPFTASAAEGETYTLVTDASELEAGAQYLVVCVSKNKAMGTQSGTYRTGVDVTITDNTIVAPVGAQVVTLGGVADAWTLGVGDTQYLYWDSANSVKTGDNACEWTITIGDGGATSVVIKDTPARKLQWNASSPRFACYTSAQTAIQLFKLSESTGGETPSCEHKNLVNIGETKDPTCTEPGSVMGQQCEDCGEVITKVETIPATGHNYVEGACSVCGEEQPIVLTFDRDAFGECKDYGWHSWTATTTTGESISGSGFIYGTTTSSIQVNGSKIGDYIYNTTALPGKIVSIKLFGASGKDARNFDILTSDTPFDSATVASLKGQATDTKKAVTEDGVTWTFTTNHKFFAIVIVDAKAAYLSSIEVTYDVCPHTNKGPVGEGKDATCTENGLTAGEKCNDCGEILAEQVVIEAPGHSFANGTCTECGEAQCTEHTWVDGEVIKPATCTETGLQAQHCSVCSQPNPTDKELPKVAHKPETDAAVDPTCVATGLTEGSHCSVCKEVLTAQETVPMVAHNHVDGVCTVCGDIVVTGTQLGDFRFGENGDAGHKDGSLLSGNADYFSGNYALALTELASVYGGAFDEKGNSALKLGTSSKAASFTFTVDSNVNTVVIYVAGYKASTAKINVNGTDYTISTKSDEGEYTKVVVDTTETKTVTLTTVSGGYRAMIDSIQFWGEPATENKIGGYTLTLGDNIGVNFYMVLADATLSDDTAYMLFTLPNGKTEKVYVKDILDKTLVQNGTVMFKFTGYIAAKEMAEDIKAQLFTAEGNTAEYTYKVQTYAQYIIDDEAYTANEKALAKALLNYGAQAQLLFGYNTDNLVNSVLDEADQAIADVTIDETYKKVYTENITGATFLGTTTMWEADTTIRHYFDITGENVTFKLNAADGTFIKDLEVQENGYGKYVAIDGIVAKDMATTYQIVVSNGTEEQTITYSVYSYFYDLLASDSYTDVEKTAIKAAYLYSQAAINYFAAN